MKKSNYAKFCQTYLEFLKSELTVSKDEFDISEIVDHAYNRFYSEFIIRLVIMITPPLLSIFVLYFDSALFKYAFSLGVLIMFLIYQFTLLRYSNTKYFHKLKTRLTIIKQRKLNYSSDEISDLITSSNVRELLDQTSAAHIYHEFKNKGEGNSEVKSIVRLYLLYFLINKDFNVSSTEKEFSYLVASILGVEDKHLVTKLSPKLNYLRNVLNSEKNELKIANKKELLEILIEVRDFLKDYKEIDKLINDIELDLAK